MVLGLPFGISDCSKCSSSSIRRSQKEGVKTGKEKTLGAEKKTDDHYEDVEYKKIKS